MFKCFRMFDFPSCIRTIWRAERRRYGPATITYSTRLSSTPDHVITHQRENLLCCCNGYLKRIVVRTAGEWAKGLCKEKNCRGSGNFCFHYFLIHILSSNTWRQVGGN